MLADAGWDREGRREGCRKRDPRGRPQGTVDRILQLGQTSVYQGGRDIPGDEDWLLAQNIKLVVNCTMNIAMPAWVGDPSMPNWVRFPVTCAITGPGRSVGNLSSFWRSLWQGVDQAKEAGGSISCSSAAPAAASSATPVSPLQKLLFGRSSGCCFSGRDVSSPGGRRDGWDSVFSDFVKNKENKRKKQQGTKSD